MENKNGQGIFYGVIGVATLIVAIIGATFAYFSASVSSDGANMTGSTLDISATALGLSVTRYSFGTTAANGDNLIPANLTKDTAAGVNAALTADCKDGNYTGCHVYTISATSTNEITDGNITLTLSTTNVQVQSDWAYSVYTGSSAESATTIVTSGNFAASGDTTVTVAQNETLNSTAKNYYVLIYLENDSSNAQNDGTAAQDATGTYTGVVNLKAGTGNVYATFTA